jgi:hypothetical protein
LAALGQKDILSSGMAGLGRENEKEDGINAQKGHNRDRRKPNSEFSAEKS